MREGSVEAVFTAPEAEAPVERRDAVEAVAGRGLRGDRYFGDGGTFEGDDLTLIEAEAVEGAQREYEVTLDPGAHRRNVVTRDVPLNHLVDRTARVGEAVVRGERLCEPCSHLQDLTEDGVLSSLVHRGGLRATVVESGLIRPGDAVRWE